MIINQAVIHLSPPSKTMILDIESLRSRHFPTHRHSYTHRDIILYHLGLGCSMGVDGPRLLYEGNGDDEGSGGSRGSPPLRVLPTYATVAAHPSIYAIPLGDYIPGSRMVRVCARRRSSRGRQQQQPLMDR
jgi:hypothetical protein